MKTNAAKTKRNHAKPKKPENPEKTRKQKEKPYMPDANGPAHPIRRLSGSESLPQ
jgi:hypothetical protein